MKTLPRWLLLLLIWLMPVAVRAELVVVVSVDSPIKTLSQEQVSRIFLRKKTTLPGNLLPEPVDLPKGDLRDAFYNDFAGMNRARISAYWAQRVFTGAAQPPLQTESVEAALSQIAASKNLIGYADKSQLKPSLRAVILKP